MNEQYSFPTRFHKNGIGASRVQLMLFVMGVFLIAAFNFSAKELPDYESYEGIYLIAGLNYWLESKDLTFVSLVKFTQSLGMDYDEFRTVVRLISAGVLSIAWLYIHRWVKTVNNAGGGINLKVRPVTGIVLLAALMVFLVEMFLVRIRGGLALSLMCLAFASHITAKRPLGNLAVTLVLAYVSYDTHANTAIVLGYFLFSPFIFDALLLGSKETQSSIISFRRGVLSYCVIVLISFVLIIGVSAMSIERGEHLASPLNAFRLFCLSVVPLIIFGGYYLFGQASITKMPQEKKKSFSLVNSDGDQVVRRINSWVRVCTGSYLSLAFALLVLYIAGFVGESGEALVRVFTLTSVVASFVYLLGSHKHSIIWLFLITSNSLFFLNTVLTAE